MITWRSTSGRAASGEAGGRRSAKRLRIDGMGSDSGTEAAAATDGGRAGESSRTYTTGVTGSEHGSKSLIETGSGAGVGGAGVAGAGVAGAGISGSGSPSESENWSEDEPLTAPIAPGSERSAISLRW